MNRFLTRLHLAASETVAAAQHRLVARRGAGFFEYALLALIAVALMVVVYTGFKGQINDMFGRLTSGVTTKNPVTNG